MIQTEVLHRAEARATAHRELFRVSQARAPAPEADNKTEFSET